MYIRMIINGCNKKLYIYIPASLEAATAGSAGVRARVSTGAGRVPGVSRICRAASAASTWHASQRRWWHAAYGRRSPERARVQGAASRINARTRPLRRRPTDRRKTRFSANNILKTFLKNKTRSSPRKVPRKLSISLLYWPRGSNRGAKKMRLLPR